MDQPVQLERPLRVYLSQGEHVESGHEWATHLELARRLAEAAGLSFGGRLTGDEQGPSYIFPVETLVGSDTAAGLGIRTEEDLFGGVVPHRFVGTKTITHPLVSGDAAAPEGWSHEFPERVREAVLTGYSAFCREDAERAARLLLERGPVRIKPAFGRAGLGQVVVRAEDDPPGALGGPDMDFASGVVVEEDLEAVNTCSVGQVRVPGLVASYYGTQRLTPNNEGEKVYGGSDLIVVRGHFDALLAQDLSEAARVAIEQARIYDRAATKCFPGLVASRRNYDVAQGRNAAGQWCSGVLEQSWRVGGASTAEVVALAAFRADPALAKVHAQSVEIYGADAAAPEGAAVFYRGTDEAVGPLVKYALIEPA